MQFSPSVPAVVERIYDTPLGKHVIVKLRTPQGRASIPYNGHRIGERVSLTMHKGLWREDR